MEVSSVSRFVRISPEKARQVARLIQGKAVEEAMVEVDLIPRKAARLISKTLRSAVANAENNHDLKRANLVVKTAVVGPGPSLKRFKAKARGMAGRIRKRSSHLTVILAEKN